MLRRLALTAAFMGVVASAGPAGAVDLLPHRAVYRLNLVDQDQGSLTSVRGGLVMEWKKSCDGWASTQRLAFQASREEGPDFSYDVRFSSWESDDDHELHFSMRSFDDLKSSEEVRGMASLPNSGKGKAVYAEPENRSVALPADTAFPTEHIKMLLAAAERGEHFLAMPVFDGSGLEALSDVSAVISKSWPATKDRPRAWTMNLAYYNLAEQGSEPEFQLRLRLRADGVTDDLTLDYGQFVLHGALVELDKLPVPACN